MNEEKQSTNPPAATGAPNFNDLEKETLKFWNENKIFEKSLEKTKEGEPFIFYDGPPFATGLPHYGSILPSVIKDAIPRYQTMKGRYVRRRWGWDCHGLPIENIVEKNLKISGKKQIEEIGVDKFNEECRKSVLRYAEEWGKTINRIARWVDFDNSYKTMDTSYQESVWAGLKQVWEKGLIYEDRKVLLYCSRCETPISNFEVAMDNSYRDITEESVYVKFKLLPRQRILNELTNDKTYLLAWTTTPWTLPGNTSLNIGADIAYVTIEVESGEHYILAKDRLSIITEKYQVIGEVLPRNLEGLEYEPLYPGVIPSTRNIADGGKTEHHGSFVGSPSRAHRIYLADFVTTTDGTGIVHNAAMYGEEDYQLAKAKDLPRMDMLDNKGQYLEMAPEHLRGVFFKDADKIVIKDLTEKNLLYRSEHYTHSYPHCYRCGTPLFYNALPAWFINVQKIKPELLKNNESVNWYPEHLKNGRFKLGIENAPDWNISRNRYWATALPFWKCQNVECKHVICVGSIDELKEKSTNFSEVYPDYAIENLEQLDLHKPYIDRIKLKCEKCGGESLRVPEVVDCWVESGSMPFAELHYPFENQELFKKRFPADFVVEYIPQTRAWFYVMHVINTMLFEAAPFKNVMTTGTILAEDGTKMSKSKNNYPDPNLVIEKYGADALRFYLLTSPVVTGEDVNFSEKNVQEVNRKVSLILYNVWTFYRMYEKGKISNIKYQISNDSHILDKWVIARLSETQTEVTKQMDAYNTVKAGRAIAEFVNELSTWYVRRNRDRMRTGDESSRQALNTLGYVLVEVSKLLAPFMPFLAEFIFRDVTGKESVHLENWSTPLAFDETIISQMQVVRQLVEIGLSMRKEQNQKVRQPLAEIEYHLKNKQILPAELDSVIAEELNVKLVSGRTDFMPKAGWAYKDEPGFKAALNLEITPELKKEGLARELERQVQDLRKKSGLKLGELVDLYYNTPSEEIEDMLLNSLDRKKTFVSQINKSFEVEVDFETQNKIEDQPVWIGMIKI
jgi:isoleucyl-tRNA synthetase